MATVIHYIVEILMITCLVHAQNDIVVTIYVEGGNEVQRGSPATLVCNYTKPVTETLVRLGWSHGMEFEFGSVTNMADFFLFNTPDDPNPRYYDPVSPPAYVMTIDDIDNGSGGSSTLTIASTSDKDNRRYWCSLQLIPDTSNPMKSVDLIVHDPQMVLVSVSLQGGERSEILVGSPITMTCEYTYDANYTIDSIAWLFSQMDMMEGESTRLANYIPPLSPPPRYPDVRYQPPAYTMTVNESGPGQGISEFMIQSVDWDDDGLYWCVVSITSTSSDSDSVALSVTDFLQNSTTARISTVNAIPTTHSTDYLDVIRVEATLVEIRWELFQVDHGYDVTQFRIFYHVGVHTNGSGSSVLFISGKEKGATITDLIPGTLYSISVEANTEQVALIEVGSIQIATLGLDNGSGFMNIIIGASVSAVLVIGLALTIFCVIKWRRSSSKQESRDREYEMRPDSAEYQDLEPRTQEEPHMYESTTLPPSVPPEISGSCKHYEVAQIATEYEVAETIPEYIEFDETAPEGRSNEEKTQYIELNKHTMNTKDKMYQALVLSDCANTAGSSVS